MLRRRTSRPAIITTWSRRCRRRPTRKSTQNFNDAIKVWSARFYTVRETRVLTWPSQSVCSAAPCPNRPRNCVPRRPPSALVPIPHAAHRALLPSELEVSRGSERLRLGRPPLHHRTYSQAVISWGSKKQASVALSSCEAEIMAAFEAAKEALFLARTDATRVYRAGS